MKMFYMPKKVKSLHGAMPRLMNTSQPELINFEIHLSPIVCDIMTNVGLV